MTKISPEGLLIIDKPTGITSHDVVQQVRRVCKVRRVGHAGTLDPLATGLLLVCIGRTTRLVEYLVHQPKVYEATMHLGITTDSYDADGTVVQERPLTANRAQLQKLLPTFTGEIQQIPPAFSAIKKDGQPLYKLARKGIAVDVPARQVTILELTLLDWAAPLAKIRVRCGAGTYIRSLAHDIGEALGCGAHIAELRRTAVGRFKEAQAVPLASLTTTTLPSHLQSPDTAVSHLPAVTTEAEITRKLLLGQQIPVQATHPQANLVRIYDISGLFIGLAKRQQEKWQPHKIFHPISDSSQGV